MGACTVHVEIFADKGWDDAIDMGIHRRFFIELEPDLGADLFVDNRQLLALFRGRFEVVWGTQGRSQRLHLGLLQ